MKYQKLPVYLSAKEVEFHIGDKVILNKVDVSIHKGDRVGLLGRNGSGKTTFLKILTEKIEPSYGTIDKKQDLKIGYLTQDFVLDEKGTVYENLRLGAEDIYKLIKEYESLSDENHEKHELFERISYLDGWNLDNKIDSLITTLNIPDKAKIVNTLSGGEKRRVALAKTILAEPDLLILDEPTNHLDTTSIEWLENYLIKHKGACIFVTHDRYFLDNVSTKIIELSKGNIYTHSGNYTDYLISKAKRQESEIATEKNRQKFLKRELEWVRKSPKGRLNKNEGRVDRYYEELNKEKLERELDVDLIIPPAPKFSNRILDIRSLSYKVNERVLFKNLSIEFKPGMKLGIVGRNGLGKSTLIKTILGKLKPTSGVADIASRTEINYMDQEKLVLDHEKTIMQEVGNDIDQIKFGDRMVTLRSYLKRFLFNEKQINAQIKTLSGGEKSRVVLAKILKNGGNFIILDEPTNDLDLNTLRLLEEALISFEGCVIVISHDRYFLNRVCSHILAFEGNGEVILSPGDYDYYEKTKTEREKEKTSEIKSENIKPKEQPKLTWQELNEIKKIERWILTAEEKVKQIEEKFFEPEFHLKPTEEIKNINQQLKEAKDKVNELYQKWEDLESKKS